MQHQQSANARPAAAPEARIEAPQPTARLSKQAFREMLAAAERVNRHHQGHLTPRAS